MKKIFIITLLISLCIISCKKDTDILGGYNNNILSFSTDTVLFDTIFTSVGSATRYLKIYNNQQDDILINSIQLAKGENSLFRINVDGEAGYNINNTLLRGGDSLYVFTEVTIDPNGQNVIFIETDSILFQIDNYSQDVDLVAWGRNAYFHSGTPDYQQYTSPNLDSMLYSEFFESIPEEFNEVYFTYYSIKENTTWTSEKPHVIYGDIIIEDGATLTIEAGSEIYLHNNSWLVISSGSSIHAIGGKNEIIWFQSDRFDSHSLIDYSNTPGQWGKIWIMPGSTNNIFNYTILKNGQTGIHVDGVNNIEDLPIVPSLTIKNSIIYNMSNIGILSQGAKVYGENILLANCGQNLLTLNIGGSYEFKHCTFANFWSYSIRQTPSIFLNNYYQDTNGNIQNRDLIKANFENCIIEGSNESEIIFDQSNEATFNYIFDHCAIKIESGYWEDWNNSSCIDNLIIETVDFIDYSLFNFELDSNSVAIDNAGINAAQDVPEDINGISRIENPDIGCFERVD
jgi:hypothetical protein